MKNKTVYGILFIERDGKTHFLYCPTRDEFLKNIYSDIKKKEYLLLSTLSGRNKKEVESKADKMQSEYKKPLPLA